MLFALISLASASSVSFTPVTVVPSGEGFVTLLLEHGPDDFSTVEVGDGEIDTAIEYWATYGCLPNLSFDFSRMRLGGSGGVYTIQMQWGVVEGDSWDVEGSMALTLGNTARGGRLAMKLEQPSGTDQALFSLPFSLPVYETVLGAELVSEVWGTSVAGWSGWAERYTNQSSGSTAYDVEPSDVGDVADKLPEGTPGKKIVKAVAAAMQCVWDIAAFLSSDKTTEDAKETEEALKKDVEEVAGALGDAVQGE